MVKELEIEKHINKKINKIDMFPKIKKEIGKFFLSEEGNISKKNILRMGVIVVAGGVFGAKEAKGGQVWCDKLNHCNKSCVDADVLGPLDDGLILVGDMDKIDFRAGSEHANMVFFIDNICHVNLLYHHGHNNLDGSNWQGPTSKHCNNFEASGGNQDMHTRCVDTENDWVWFKHDNEGGRRQKWYEVETQCTYGGLHNKIMFSASDERNINIGHENSMEEFENSIIDAKSECGSMHDSND